MCRQTHRGHREDLVGEHPFGDAGQLILLIVFLIVWVVDSFVVLFSTFAAQYVSLFFRVPMGLLFLILAGYLAQQGMRIVFGEKRAAPEMIEKGVFKLVRHPVYLGCILFYVGLFMFTFSVAAAVICVVIMVFYHYIAKYEERMLLSEFGTKYEQYMKSVPMWIPRL